MKVTVSHPTGNANVRAALAGLYDAGILNAYYTAIASFEGTLFDKLAAFGPLAEIRRRRLDPRLKPFTHLAPWREAGRLIASKLGAQNLTRHEEGIFSIDKVYHSIDNFTAGHLMANKSNAVFAYEDGALFTFKAAKQLGIKCLYDLPIGYWRTQRNLLAAEATRWPEWASTLTTFKDTEAKLARKDEELELADHIFVASSFTAKTLLDYPGKLGTVSVIPYGFPEVGDAREYASLSGGRKLKLLFVGGLSQRKGIADMFAAVNKLRDHVELTVVGRKTEGHCQALDTELGRHNWMPSMPHGDILKLMRQHDVLLFPSLFEGFGLVITEAMAQGTPVITTDRTAGPDVIVHGHSGWIIEAGSENAIYQTIEKILSNPQLVSKVGKAAMEAARLRPWNIYGNELARAITNNN
ncbi:glycosyltransferase family 4 protein [Mucilaginibacter pallidiroseus]|uniref:Glycosyltransferase family 4 protein n=1 Tax=Mucilaginibacter pallidiroseus TaxID=2599295 RepID=A0A563U893_9SPHI|nr:glycosyltransferase family 4 protein [Mucilaginibacter pallidiroseus]TWR27577.1 glycosyltransferase family 4 protein [Mucilaginibacter pallidiroseus]